MTILGVEKVVTAEGSRHDLYILDVLSSSHRIAYCAKCVSCFFLVLTAVVFRLSGSESIFVLVCFIFLQSHHVQMNYYVDSCSWCHQQWNCPHSRHSPRPCHPQSRATQQYLVLGTDSIDHSQPLALREPGDSRARLKSCLFKLHPPRSLRLLCNLLSF